MRKYDYTVAVHETVSTDTHCGRPARLWAGHVQSVSPHLDGEYCRLRDYQRRYRLHLANRRHNVAGDSRGRPCGSHRHFLFFSGGDRFWQNYPGQAFYACATIFAALGRHDWLVLADYPHHQRYNAGAAGHDHYAEYDDHGPVHVDCRDYSGAQPGCRTLLDSGGDHSHPGRCYRDPVEQNYSLIPPDAGEAG